MVLSAIYERFLISHQQMVAAIEELTLIVLNLVGPLVLDGAHDLPQLLHFVVIPTHLVQVA